MSVVPVVDLRHKFGPARNQGGRQTCLAFAISDAHAEARGLPYEELSAEFIFYHAARRAAVFNPHGGITVDNGMITLKNEGQPLESGWPYLPQLPRDVSSYRPPADYGDVYTRKSTIGVYSDIRATLDNGKSALAAMAITTDFHYAVAGKVIQADSNSKFAGYHAVLIVGYGQENNDTVYLIRNSWGTKWCEAGNAWLTEHYLTSRLYAVAMMH
jgi:papain like protease